jgi:hypothetical protein
MISAAMSRKRSRRSAPLKRLRGTWSGSGKAELVFTSIAIVDFYPAGQRSRAICSELHALCGRSGSSVHAKQRVVVNHEQKPLPSITGIWRFDRPIVRVENTQ